MFLIKVSYSYLSTIDLPLGHLSFTSFYLSYPEKPSFTWPIKSNFHRILRQFMININQILDPDTSKVFASFRPSFVFACNMMLISCG